MPEGPEVKTVARTLSHALVGHHLGSLWHSHQKLRRHVDYDGLRRLENMMVDDVSCYGKILFISVKKKPAIMAQLGMTGQLVVTDHEAPVLAHTHIRWRLKNSPQELRYVDPRRFGLVDVCDDHERTRVIGRLGPDPFALSSSQSDLIIKAIKKSTRAIKEILLDQSVVVGVGNIYASEALFLARIHPEKPGNKLSVVEQKRLVEAIVEVLHRAYENCGTTFSNYVDGSGAKGKNLDFLKVFQRYNESCLVCSATIVRIKQGGRSTFFCPQCQK